MSKPLPKDDLIKHQQATVRQEWLRRLREQGERQCSGLHRVTFRADRDRYISQVCAVALLGEITEGPQWWLRGDVELTAIGAKAGLDYVQVSKVITMNDGGPCPWTGKLVRPHSFRQIARVIERWFA